MGQGRCDFYACTGHYGVLALYIAWRQIEEFRNAAQVQHIDELVHRWDCEMVGVRKALALKRLDPKQQTLLPLDTDNPPRRDDRYFEFFEHMDLMIDRGYLSKEDVWREFSEVMFPLYADARPYIDREQKDNSSLRGGLSDLMEDMRGKEIEDNGGISNHPSAKEILDFCQGEATLQHSIPIPRERISNRQQVKKKS